MVTKSHTSPKADANQRKLFAQPEPSRAADEALVLCALGEFQRRGKLLADRDLPLDRLRGALRRQTERTGVAELTDERFAEILSNIGAQVRRVPSFVAKHPFRVIVSATLAERARTVFDESQNDIAAENDDA